MPIKPVAPVRTRIATIRLAPEEYEVLAKLADRHGVTFSELVRRTMCDIQLPPQRLPRVNAEAVYQLSKLGSNLNQAVHAFNRWAAVSNEEKREVWHLHVRTIAELARKVHELRGVLLH